MALKHPKTAQKATLGVQVGFRGAKPPGHSKNGQGCLDVGVSGSGWGLGVQDLILENGVLGLQV